MVVEPNDPNRSRQLENKVCLVTGATRGIGRAIAERFAEEGALVYANGRTDGGIDEWARKCGEVHRTVVTPVYFDVRDIAGAKQAVMQIKREHERLDVLVNCAGVVTYEMIGMIDLDRLREMIDVNVVAVIQMIQLVSRVMSRNKAGSIINISSIAGSKGVAGQMAYSATKGAVIALTKSAAKELAPQGIRVNAVAPGMIDTERLRHAMERLFKEKIDAVGMGRLGRPEEVADACVFLGSDHSSYVTGQVLEVDGSTII